jgi:activator of HSP90 ATPase
MSNIHQEVVFPASPSRIYEVLLDANQFRTLSGGAPAEISAEAGGAFSCFGGMVSGRNVELIPHQRIVQAWRAEPWDKGVYSIAKFELRQEGSETRVIFDHAGFPPEQQEHLEGGWHKHYWEPLRKHLAL